MGGERGIQRFAVVSLVLTATAVSLSAQDRPGKDDILLSATFRDGPEDMVRSDGRGTYITGRDLYVYFHPDGTLHLWVGPQSGRRLIFLFSRVNRVRPQYVAEDPYSIDITQFCCLDPECINQPETQDLEPLLDVKIHTWIGEQFGPPQFNLLALTPAQKAVPVRFWVHFCTRERADFSLTYNENICPACRATHGWVWVKALDTNGDVATTERWEITSWDPNEVKDPVWHNNAFANLWRYLPTRKGGVSTKCDFGDYAVPFLLWLDRAD